MLKEIRREALEDDERKAVRGVSRKRHENDDKSVEENIYAQSVQLPAGGEWLSGMDTDPVFEENQGDDASHLHSQWQPALCKEAPIEHSTCDRRRRQRL